MGGRDFLIRQVALAAQLGHKLDVEPRGQRWRAVCSCGYESTGRTSQALALAAAVHHAGGVAGEATRNGADLPPAKAAGL